MDPAPDHPPQTMVWQRLRGGREGGVLVHRLTDHRDVAAHDHVFHELVLVEAGTAEHRAADGTRSLRPGDLIVLQPLVWHAYHQTRSLTIVNCLIDHTLMRRLTPLLVRGDNAFGMFHKRTPDPRRDPPLILHASPAERAVLCDRFNSMMVELGERRSGWQAATTAGLLDVLVAVMRLYAKPGSRPAAEPLASPITGRVERAVLEAASHLEMHFDQPVCLASLAQRVRLSPGHLSRSFSRHMGMGIVAYVHRLRAEEACRRLRCTDAPISHIASRVGYDELAYFSRCFRRHVGQSPRDYRRASTPAIIDTPPPPETPVARA